MNVRFLRKRRAIGEEGMSLGLEFSPLGSPALCRRPLLGFLGWGCS